MPLTLTDSQANVLRELQAAADVYAESIKLVDTLHAKVKEMAPRPSKTETAYQKAQEAMIEARRSVANLARDFFARGDVRDVLRPRPPVPAKKGRGTGR
jgi:hypothetical protein